MSASLIRSELEPRDGEIQMKAWVEDEAVRKGVTSKTIYRRIRDGEYPKLKRRTVNPRLIYVEAR